MEFIDIIRRKFEERKAKPRFGVKIFMAVLVGFFMYRIFFKNPTVIDVIRAHHETVAYEKQKATLDTATAVMSRHIRDLSSSRDSIEKVAREKYHLSAPGEDVYIVNE